MRHEIFMFVLVFFTQPELLKCREGSGDRHQLRIPTFMSLGHADHFEGGLEKFFVTAASVGPAMDSKQKKLEADFSMVLFTVAFEMACALCLVTPRPSKSP